MKPTYLLNSFLDKIEIAGQVLICALENQIQFSAFIYWWTCKKKDVQNTEKQCAAVNETDIKTRILYLRIYEQHDSV